eukprot:8185679-Lingulodinium_polyedra.AAC.1
MDHTRHGHWCNHGRFTSVNGHFWNGRERNRFLVGACLNDPSAPCGIHMGANGALLWGGMGADGAFFGFSRPRMGT